MQPQTRTMHDVPPSLTAIVQRHVLGPVGPARTHRRDYEVSSRVSSFCLGISTSFQAERRTQAAEPIEGLYLRDATPKTCVFTSLSDSPMSLLSLGQAGAAGDSASVAVRREVGRTVGIYTGIQQQLDDRREVRLGGADYLLRQPSPPSPLTRQRPGHSSQFALEPPSQSFSSTHREKSSGGNPHQATTGLGTLIANSESHTMLKG